MKDNKKENLIAELKCIKNSLKKTEKGNSEYISSGYKNYKKTLKIERKKVETLIYKVETDNVYIIDGLLEKENLYKKELENIKENLYVLTEEVEDIIENLKSIDTKIVEFRFEIKKEGTEKARKYVISRLKDIRNSIKKEEKRNPRYKSLGYKNFKQDIKISREEIENLIENLKIGTSYFIKDDSYEETLDTIASSILILIEEAEDIVNNMKDIKIKKFNL